ncbi:MAG: SEC59/DGK1/VTE5 family protein [Xenococcaceae cyanobacterium MO_207.B15]|nr:SEC59/DGK1/VTE5 family protein [Xenococcaceae cyanobacterium MO_207.B15]
MQNLTANYFDNYFYTLTLVFIYLGILVLIAEALSRYISNDPELTRKVVHIGSGNVILLAWWLHISTWIIVAAAAIASIIALISYFVPIIPSINSVGRKSLGTLFYAISIGVLAAIFWNNSPQYTAIGILIMAWGDGMAAIIGQRFGKHSYRIFDIKKSWEGSLTMAVTSFVVTSSILLFTQENTGQTWLISAIVAVIATALEAFSKLGIDNLTVPLGSAGLCYFIVNFF